MIFEDDSFPNAYMEFSNVSFRRGERPLFDGLSFSLSAGHLLWITGANGIGKTSILKLAAGLWRPSDGTIRHSISDQPCEARDIATYLGHIDAFEPLLSAKESLEFWAEIYHSDLSVTDIFHQIDLSAQQNLRTASLSAGQKRRLAFARLLLSRRPIWILDEPKAALDEPGQDLIENLISTHLAQGGSALIATHDDTKPLGQKASRIKLEPAK